MLDLGALERLDRLQKRYRDRCGDTISWHWYNPLPLRCHWGNSRVIEAQPNVRWSRIGHPSSCL